MKIIINLAVLLIIACSAYAQPIIYQGNPGTISGFKGGVLTDQNLYLPLYKTIGTDTAMVALDSSSRGKGFKVTKSMILRWVSTGIPGVTLQQAILNGNDLDQDNVIVFGSNRLTYSGRRMDFLTDTMYSEGLIEYMQDRRNEYNPLTLPAWKDVKDTVSEAMESLISIIDVIRQATIDSFENQNFQIVTNKGDTTTNNIKIHKTDASTARLYVQSDSGIASLRLHSGDGNPSYEAAAFYQNANGRLAIQNARPGADIELTVTTSDSITYSAIKVTDTGVGIGTTDPTAALDIQCELGLLYLMRGRATGRDVMRLDSAGSFEVFGPNNGLTFKDRLNIDKGWLFYANNDTARIWNIENGDLLTFQYNTGTSTFNYHSVNRYGANPLSNGSYLLGNYEAFVSTSQYAAGARPGYGFHMQDINGYYLYCDAVGTLRMRSATGVTENIAYESWVEDQEYLTEFNAYDISSITSTGTYSPMKLKHTYKVDATSGNVTINLVPFFTSQVVVLKRMDNSGNTITIQSASGNIDDAASKTLNSQYETVQLQWDGTQYLIIN